MYTCILSIIIGLNLTVSQYELSVVFTRYHYDVTTIIVTTSSTFIMQIHYVTCAVTQCYCCYVGGL